jgi:CheY-like chemotaxis protein
VVLVVITELLQDSGYKVFTQTSPIGATQVIVREEIDAAVIDVNLPVMQGDNVVRLFRGWDRVSDLPVIIISGAPEDKLTRIQQELPGVKIVRKTEMDEALVRTLDELLTGSKAARSPRSAATRAADTRSEAKPRGQELIQRFTEQLADAMPHVQEVWAEFRSRRFGRAAGLSEKLLLLRGQAELLGLQKVGHLLDAVRELVLAAVASRAFAHTADRCMNDAISALIALKRSGTGEFALSPDSLVQALKHATAETRIK